MSFVLGNAPIPLTDAIARPKRTELYGKDRTDPLEGRVTDAWADWLSKLALSLGATATRISSVALTGQAAAIAATDISNGALKTGLYRFSYVARITQAAGISSSLDVTLSWTRGGVAQSEVSAAATGNTLDTRLHGDFLIHIDANSPVTYATTRASAGVPSMQYELDVVLEVIQA